MHIGACHPKLTADRAEELRKGARCGVGRALGHGAMSGATLAPAAINGTPTPQCVADMLEWSMCASNSYIDTRQTGRKVTDSGKGEAALRDQNV